ncbi:MAG: hypothetical protein ACK5NT_01745 [Pyrinomonadaceae bacterium]
MKFDILYCHASLSKCRTMIIFIIFCSVFVIGLNNVFAQETDTKKEDVPKQIAPPPMREMSKTEDETLDSKTKVSDKTKVALELMEARLVKSETFGKKNEFKDALDNLGGFAAIMTAAYNFLTKGTNPKKNLKSIKKFEIGLRKFLPRLEVLRRESPYKYEYHVQRIIRDVREFRSGATENMYGKIEQ